MPLNPQDIVRKEFREAFRGYNQADVDLFLDEVVEEYARLSEENQKMRVRLAAMQQEVARLREGRAPTSGEPADPQRVELEVRARIRRFLEDQLRALDTSPTVERLARELPQAPQQPRAVPLPHAVPEQAAEPEPIKRQEPREPFWAGE